MISLKDQNNFSHACTHAIAFLKIYISENKHSQEFASGQMKTINDQPLPKINIQISMGHVDFQPWVKGNRLGNI